MIYMSGIDNVKNVLLKQIPFNDVQNRLARFVLIGVHPGEEVVVGCLEDGSWGTNKYIQGCVGGFSLDAIRVASCLASLGMISRDDEKEFKQSYFKCSKENNSNSEIAELERLSKKHGFTVVK